MEQIRRNLTESRRTYEELARKLVGKNPFAISGESKQEDESSNRSESPGIETAELFFAKEKLEQETATYNQLNARVMGIRAEYGRDSSIISRSLARAPSAPIEDLPLNRMLLAAGLMFFLPFAIGILIELRRKAVGNG